MWIRVSGSMIREDKTYLSYHSTDKNEVFNKAIKFRVLQVIVKKHSRLPIND